MVRQAIRAVRVGDVDLNQHQVGPVAGIERLNMFIPERERQLKVPDLKFNRRIGLYAHQHFNVDGQPLDAAKYLAYLESVLPRPEDIARVHDIEKEPNWIEPKKADSLQQ